MCRIGKIKNSNVAGVNISGIGIFVNQSIENKRVDEQTKTSAKVYVIGIVRCWTMFWVIVAVLLSIAAIIFCIAALYRKIEDDNPGYDYLGVIVGILALFITFVVAWNIWATITTKEEIKEVTEAANKLDTLEKQVQELKNVPDAYLFYILASSRFSQKEYYEAFDFYSTSVILFFENNVAYNKYSVVALSYIEICLIQSSDSEKEKFKANSSLISNKLSNIEVAINKSSAQDFSQAREQIKKIQNIAKEYGYI